MAESDKVFAGSIPKFYDTLMVPLIFEAYAADMAELVASSSPGSVLETAAGSGVVTRALAPKLSADARYVVTDLNQPMLDYAATRQGSDSRIEWRQADALDLPFEGLRAVVLGPRPNRERGDRGENQAGGGFPCTARWLHALNHTTAPAISSWVRSASRPSRDATTPRASATGAAGGVMARTGSPR